MNVCRTEVCVLCVTQTNSFFFLLRSRKKKNQIKKKGRPCERCVRRKSEPECVDVIHRKKGRPRKNRSLSDFYDADFDSFHPQQPSGAGGSPGSGPEAEQQPHPQFSGTHHRSDWYAREHKSTSPSSPSLSSSSSSSSSGKHASEKWNKRRCKLRDNGGFFFFLNSSLLRGGGGTRREGRMILIKNRFSPIGGLHPKYTKKTKPQYFCFGVAHTTAPPSFFFSGFAPPRTLN